MKNQKGFGLVGALALIVVMAVITFGGYRVWHNHKNKPTNTAITQPRADTEAANWLAYTAPCNDYSIKIPDGWSLIVNEADKKPTCHVIDPQLWLRGGSLALKSGQKAQLTTAEDSRDGIPEFNLMYIQDDVIGTYLDKNAVAQPSLKTDSGLTINKYLYTQTTRPKEITLDTPFSRGEKYYQYFIEKGKNFIYVSYYDMKGQPDYSLNVEKALKTLRLLQP